MSAAYSRWVVQNRWLVLIVMLVLAVAAAAGMKRLAMTTDYRVFFSADNPQLAAFEKLQNTYTKNDNVLVVMAPKNGDVFTGATLDAVREYTAMAWQTPHSIRVDSVSNFQHTRGVDDDLIVKDLVPEGALSAEERAGIKRTAIAEPLLVHRLISTSGDVTAVNVTIHAPEKDPRKEIPEVVAHVRADVEKLRAKYPDIAFHLTGTVMMNNAFPEAQKNDMRTLVPIMFGVVLVLMYLLLRHAAGVFVTLLVIALAIASGLGLWGWLSGRLTPPTASVPTIILTLAVADCIHILGSYLHKLRQGAASRAEAMTEALRVNLQPVFLTSFTTAVGFLSMNFSDSPPFRDLGNMVAGGVMLAFVFAVTVLPALVVILPGRARREATFGEKQISALGGWVTKNVNKILVAGVVIAAVLVSGIPRNELNDAFVEYFGKATQFRQDTDFATERLTGIYTVDYSLSAGRPEGVADPAFLKTLDAFAEWFRAQPEVVHVNSFSDIMKRLNMNLHGDDRSYYRVPENRELAAQYLLLYEMSLPFGLDLNNQLNVEKSSVRLTVTAKNITTNELRALEARGRAWLEKNAPAQMVSHGASPAIMFAHIGERTMKSMWSGNAIGMVAITLTLMIAFRSFGFGLVSMLPNILPVLLAFGIWGYSVGQVGLSLSIVFGMTLGIVVDDTIHFMSKYLRARREQGLDAEAAVRYVFDTVGTALWVTSVVLIAGFAVLAASDFKMNSGMGTLSALTIGLALLADFLLLPALVLKLKEKLRV